MSDKVRGDKVEGDKVGGDKNVYHMAAAEAKEPAEARESYLNRIIERTNIVSLAGIDPKAAGDQAEARLSLQAVYTGLVTAAQEEQLKGLERMTAMAYPGQARPISAVAQLNRHPRLVIMGDPGGGKSTFVKFAALCLAGAFLGREDANLKLLTTPLPDKNGKDGEERQPWEHGRLLPILVVLSHFAVRGLPPPGEKGTAEHLWRFIVQDLAEGSLGDYAPFLLRRLRHQGGMLLLDGLDEVPEAHRRRGQIKEAVEDFAAAFPKVRIVVTSRTYAYQNQDWRLPGFAEAVLAPFGPGQIRRFIDAWYEHMAVIRNMVRDDARGRAVILKERIFDNERLLALAERPLLLTLMASLHAWRGGSLPEGREELYNDAVELLLDWWESPKVERDAEGNVILQQRSLAELLKVGRKKVRAFLNELAFKAHHAQPVTSETADITEGELVGGLMRLNRNEEIVVNPALLVEYLSHRAGLLLPRGEGVYTFPHRTFQEYLAACHLTDDDYPDKVVELVCADPNRWREVALLAGAKARRGGTFGLWSLVNALCYEEPEAAGEAAEAAWGALLASQLLVETSELGQVSKANQKRIDNVRHSLVSLIGGDKLPAVERALAAANLARLKDPRLEVMDVDSMAFCFVPQGAFWMGSDVGSDSEKPAHEVMIPYPFWLARYPVTTAQFEQFVADGGYNEAGYWTEAAEAGIWRAGRVKGLFTSDWRDQPIDYGPRFTVGNQPVVGITWYEALAFTRWLADRWRGFGWLPEGWTVRLPSEAEWEKGARGGLEIPTTLKMLGIKAGQGFNTIQLALQPDPQRQRRYPWGEEADPERANYGDSAIGRPSGVGCFAEGVSVYGVEEMSGNTYEWTRSRFQEYPYRANDGREEKLGRNQYEGIVIRGGYFGADETQPRCSFRDWGGPDYDYFIIGFRVCVVSPFSSSGL